jgi:hypothetical protein
METSNRLSISLPSLAKASLPSIVPYVAMRRLPHGRTGLSLRRSVLTSCHRANKVSRELADGLSGKLSKRTRSATDILDHSLRHLVPLINSEHSFIARYFQLITAEPETLSQIVL